MEYFIGSFFTLIVIWYASKIFKRIDSSGGRLRPRVSQSRSFDLLLPIVDIIMPRSGWTYQEPLETQSRNHFSSFSVKLVIYNDNAYWLHENNFYTAKMVNGNVDRETTKPVDTMSMNAVELNELAQIVEKLREETGNDSSNSGNQKF
jgi:hypothetical protein